MKHLVLVLALSHLLFASIFAPFFAKSALISQAVNNYTLRVHLPSKLMRQFRQRKDQIVTRLWTNVDGNAKTFPESSWVAVQNAQPIDATADSNPSEYAIFEWPPAIRDAINPLSLRCRDKIARRSALSGAAKNAWNIMLYLYIACVLPEMGTEIRVKNVPPKTPGQQLWIELALEESNEEIESMACIDVVAVGTAGPAQQSLGPLLVIGPRFELFIREAEIVACPPFIHQAGHFDADLNLQHDDEATKMFEAPIRDAPGNEHFFVFTRKGPTKKIIRT